MYVCMYVCMYVYYINAIFHKILILSLAPEIIDDFNKENKEASTHLKLYKGNTNCH